MICYLDMVSHEAPQHSKTGPKWKPHAVRIALAIENDADEITDKLLALVEPQAPCDDGWITRYGVRRAELGATATSPSELISGMWFQYLKEAPALVAHNYPFHRDVLVGLLDDAGAALVASTIRGFDGYCTMRGATDVCRIPPSKGSAFKPPRLAEAWEFFTGTPMKPIETLTWREVALQQLNAVRTVHWGIQRKGVPPLIEASE